MFSVRIVPTDAKHLGLAISIALRLTFQDFALPGYRLYANHPVANGGCQATFLTPSTQPDRRYGPQGNQWQLLF